MKNLAKLTLFFSLCFIILFVAAILLRLLSSWIEIVRFIPTGTKTGENITEAAWKAFPVALYLSILFALSYSARRKMVIPVAIIGILVLGCAFSLGVSVGISRIEALKIAAQPVSPLEGGPGLILSQSHNDIILLTGSRDVRLPRLVSIPGRPLIYQAAPVGPNNTILSLPALSFGENTPWFLRSLILDFSLSAGEMKRRLEIDFFPFAVYVFSLILLLASLRILLELSQWPLANLFIGALVFRMVLTLEIFLNTREINTLVTSFLKVSLPPELITPAVFSALAVLFLFYTLLVRIARVFSPLSGGKDDD